MKKTITLLCLLLTLVSFSQTVNYTVNNGLIANPERGQYHYRIGVASNFVPLSYSDLVSMRINEKITLVWRCYQLDSFINSTISADFLSKIQTDFNTMRSAGVKCILRFSYKESGSVAPFEADKTRILTHIDQLEPITVLNEDVISSMEAGFIGKHGEWYESTYFGTDNLTATNYQDRYDVAIKIMKLTPNRMVSYRTPAILRKLWGTDPILIGSAYNGSFNSRAASHNDCFLSSATDYGTYINTSIEYPYLEQQTLYTLNGGEACSVTTYSACDNTLFTMGRFHFNYLNSDYNSDVHNYWQTNGCYDEIKKRLGYRYVLNNSIINNNILNVSFTNVGFGNLFNDRKCYLVMRNTSNNNEYSFPINLNLRTIPINSTVTISKDLSGLVPNGMYKLFLNFPDNQLSSPNYSIQLANLSTWESNTGYNDLLQFYEANNLSVNIFVIDNVVNIQNLNNYKFRLYDINGKLLKYKSLNLSSLPIGIYVIKVKSKEGTIYTQKIYKS